MKVVWAVNPLDKKLPLAAMGRLLQRLSPGGPDIEAVYVAGRHARAPRLTLHTAEKALCSALPDAYASLPATVLWEPSGSQSAATQRLITYALRKRADLIAVYTHARRGIERFFVGSFAEDIATLSPVPVLFANPNFKLPGSVARVLFATDFSLSSMAAFRELLNLAKQAGWRIVVFHAADPFYRAESSSTAQYRRGVREKLADLQGMAVEAGVDAIAVHDQRYVGVAELVLEYADLHACELICVAAQRNAARHVLLGSVTRQILRSSSRPLIVMKA